MSDLAKMQRAFAKDIRTDGDESFGEQPGLKIYRELFFNSVCGFLDGTFPVCKEAVGDERWKEYSRAFFRDHQSNSPLFLEISEEFLAWLVTQQSILGEFPYLAELAHYEWLELAVDVMDVEGFRGEPDGLFDPDSPILINPASIAACYQYPVHQVSGFEPEVSEQMSGFVVYRDLADKVRFISCTPLSLMILETARAEPMLTARQAVGSVMSQAGLHGEAALQGALQVLGDWHRQGVIRS